METKLKQSKFHWNFSICLFVQIIFCWNIWAADIYPSDYSGFAGQRFFILTDSTFSEREEAKIRVELRPNAHEKESLSEYGGIDIALYRVKSPVDFLKTQKNLHHIKTDYRYEHRGLLSNAVSYIWDSFYKKSRLAWQRILSFNARKVAIETNENFRQLPGHEYKTKFTHYKQFKEMPGYDLVSEFRYPIQHAKPNKMDNVRLRGSTHTFFRPNDNNISVPVGKLKSGLYLVEAVIGDERASTILFVSNSVLISKTSSNEAFLWSSSKDSGHPMKGTEVLLYDGVGVLRKGVTNEQGVLRSPGKIPELMYLIGQDSNGGVFISENYYYDSEIYNDKIYTFTDRPLYRPGDLVNVKVLGRNFTSSTKSKSIHGTTYNVQIIDSAGTVLLVKKVHLGNEKIGNDFSFKLPQYALSGGYTILLKNKNDSYISEFRVSKYSKPHYSIDVNIKDEKIELNKEINAIGKLTYSSGEAVRGATVRVTLRKQKLSISENDTSAQSHFPVKIEELELATNEQGLIDFKIPPVAEPTRYIILLKAKDEASYSVSFTKEILIEAEALSYKINSLASYTEEGADATFYIEKITTTPDSEKNSKLSWKTIRLQDQQSRVGTLKDDKSFNVKFEKEGLYNVILLNSENVAIAEVSHIVRGADLKSIPGSIGVKTDKNEYEIGDTAKVLLYFPEPITDALLTLERDRVENFSLVSTGSEVFQVKKLSPTQWIVEIPIKEWFAPNVTFSVLYVKSGQYVFSNKGLKIKKPQIQIAYELPKLDYKVGETVKLSIQTTYNNKPIPSNVTLSVVDEMIYVLQPEVAPVISEFFYHSRRNQVKTSSSLDFHTYDQSSSASGRLNPSASYDDRPLKMRERPRREDIDTAFWNAKISTDSTGKAFVEFKMPDSITRWRLTARAMDTDGNVGQAVTHISTKQNSYLKWGSVRDVREGDKLKTSVFAFNLSNETKAGSVNLDYAGKSQTIDFDFVPGMNVLKFDINVSKSNLAKLKLNSDLGSDSLEQRINIVPVNWVSTHATDVFVEEAKNELIFPPKAFNFRLVSFGKYHEKFMAIANSLAVYPHGCIEQISSKLISLSLAYEILRNATADNSHRLEELQNRILDGRNRIVQMANLGGAFGWYSGMLNDSYMTAYAYLADFYASRVLDIEVPKAQWQTVTKVFAESPNVNLARQAVILWVGALLAQPVQRLLAPLASKIVEAKKNAPKIRGYESLLMSYSPSKESLNFSLLLLELAAREAVKNKYDFSEEDRSFLKEKANESYSEISNESHFLLELAGVMFKKDPAKIINVDELYEIMHNTLRSGSTADKSFSLILLGELVREVPIVKSNIKLASDWRKVQSVFGLDTWQYAGKTFDKTKIVEDGLAENKSRFKLYYDSYTSGESKKPVVVKRILYRLEKKDNVYIALKMQEGEIIKSSELYIDEVELESEKKFTHSMVEMPLPPGAVIERGLSKLTIQMPLESGQNTTLVVDDSAKDVELGYTIPIESIDGNIITRHILSFSTIGTFTMPMARFFEMYQPEEYAYEKLNSPSVRSLVVE